MKPPKKWFEISNASEASADVYIYDSIGAYGVSAAGFIAEINAIKAPVINLHLNSGGGSVFDGLAIYTGIQSHPARVRVLIDGIAASMAGVIAMAGDEIVMAENAFLMIHRVSSGVEGTAETMRAEAALLEKLEEQIVAIYAARTGKSPGALFKAMQAETWYSAAESLAEGFCTSVAPLKSPSNCVDLSKFGKAPAALVDAADTGKPMPTAEIVSEPVAAVVSEPVAVVTAEPVAAITAESLRLAVKDAVEAAHAAAEVALNAVRADFNAKLTSKDNELAALSVKLASAENLSAAKLGVLPVVFTPAATTAPGDILAQYRALEGAARTAFFQKNKDAIWKAYDAENAKPA
jgi:ATP-dependent protease ClpP protease subunit